GKYAQAEPHLQKVLTITCRTLGEDHPDTAVSYDNLAVNLGVQGKYGQAEPHLQKALAIRRRTLGEDHPDMVLSYINMAINLHAQGKDPEAEAMALAAACSYEAARLRVGFTGLDRAEFASRHSPLTLVTALLARRGRDQDAWRHWESGLARGLSDDLQAR